MMKNALSKLPRLRPLALWSIVLFSSWVGHVVAADVAKSSAERLAELRNEAMIPLPRIFLIWQLNKVINPLVACSLKLVSLVANDQHA